MEDKKTEQEIQQLDNMVSTKKRIENTSNAIN